MNTEMTLTEACDAYCQYLLLTYGTKREATFHFEAEEGEKYVKIMRVDNHNRESRSAHSFIVRDDNAVQNPKSKVFFKKGDILKAASWAAPARNFKRGNVMDSNYGRTWWAGA